MKKIRNYPIIMQFAIPLLLVGGLFMVNFFSIRHIINNSKYDSEIINIAGRNQVLVQKIELLSTSYGVGNNGVKKELRKTIATYRQSVTVLKKGGKAQGFENIISPINKEVLPIFSNADEIWGLIKRDIDIILYQPSILKKKNTDVIGVDSLGHEITQTSITENINPAITISIANIKKNSKLLGIENGRIFTELQKRMDEKRSWRIGLFFIIMLFNMIIVFVIFLLNRGQFILPVQKILDVLSAVSNGNLNKKVGLNSTNEVGQIANKVDLISNNLDEKVGFIRELSKGNYKAQIELIGNEDVLGSTLIDMRESFQRTAKEEKKRKEEDKKQNWVTQGLAKLGDILRKDNDNIERLSFNIISYLVQFLEANQGGVYVVNDNEENDKFIEQAATVAFSKQKFIKKRIEFGEGIIGRCMLEQQTIYMTDIPEEYIEITSGLGKAKPRSLLIVPLKLNEEIFGVVEIASFILFEPYQVEFVEKVAESIASTISSVKINIKTAILLRDSQTQADTMRTQEDKMRKNMDDLRKMQSEARRQEERLTSFTDSVNHTLIRAEYDTAGILVYANTKFLEKLGYRSNYEVEGRHISIFIDEKDKIWFEKVWEPLAQGGKHFEGNMKHITKDEKDVWMMATYTAVRKANGDVEKILFLGIDTTEQKKESLDHKGQIEALNNSGLKVEYFIDGRYNSCNDIYRQTMEYKEIELQNRSVFDFVEREDLLEFKLIWDNVLNNIPYRGQVRRKTQSGKMKWFHATFSAVKDMYGQVAKVVYIANDITVRKEIELKAKKQEEQLRAKMSELTEIQLKMEENQLQLRQANDNMQENEEKLLHNLEELEVTQSEMARQKNEMQSLLDTIDPVACISELDIDGRVISFNQTLQRIFGISTKRAIGKYYWNLAIIEDQDAEKMFWETIINGQNRKRMMNFDVGGKRYWISENYSPIYNERGKVAKILNIGFDITETKESEYLLKQNAEELATQEEELRQNMEELQTTQDEMSRQKHKLEEMNKRLEANQEIIQKAYSKSKNKEEEVEEKNKQLAASEEELRQNIEYMVSMQDDMLKQKTEMQSLLNAIDPIACLSEYSLDGSVLKFNQKIEQILRIPEEQAVGKNHSDFFEVEDINQYKEFWHQLKLGKKMERISQVNAGGDKFWLSETYAPIFDEDENIEKILNIGFDITKVKEQELELRQYNEEIASQEEELRQNMEKLKSTQEELIRQKNEIEASNSELETSEKKIRNQVEQMTGVQKDAKKKQVELTGVMDAINNSALVLTFDINGFIIDVNKAMLQLFMIAPEDINGKHFTTFITTEKDSQEYKKFLNAMQLGLVFRTTHLVRIKEQEFWLSEVLSPIKDANGNVVKILNIATDITDIKKHELELKQNAEELAAQEEELRQNMEEMAATQETIMIKQIEMRALVDAVDDSLISVEYATDGTILHINQNFIDVTGLTADKFIGKNVFDIVGRTDDFMKTWANLQKGFPFRGEVIRDLPSGKKTFFATYSPAKDENGNVYKIFYLGQDITKTKELEILATQKAKELDIKTKELDTKQQAEQKKMSEILDKHQKEKAQLERKIAKLEAQLKKKRK